MKINIINTSVSLAAVAAVISASGVARATELGDCSAVNPGKPHIYMAGSSAVKPFVQAVSDALKADQVIIYVSQGSCVGVADMFDSDNNLLPTGTGKGLVGVNDTCTIPAATKADVGVSDVFATSCAGVATVPAGFGDFQGPVQVMNFVVPKGADAATQSISAEAAYLVFGFDPASNDPATQKSYADGTPWTVKDAIWIRGAGSGTQSMIASAIKVPPASWALNAYTDGNNIAHAVAGGSGDIVKYVGTPSDINATIGILASTELDDARDKIRGLAFQGYDQSCGYWPDSTSSAKDKLNVRNGKYQIWGGLHMYTKVGNDKKPVSSEVADLIAYIRGDKDPDGAGPVDIVELEATKNVIPQCAMQVSRDTEVGNMMSVNPTCTCWYDNVRGGDTTGCKACKTDNDCKTAGTSCSFGYCEAI